MTRSGAGAAWAWVALAGLFEVGFTYALKMEQHSDKYLGMFIVCTVLSFECLSRALKGLPVGLAYAVWTGIGSVGTIIAGLLLFGDSLSPLRLTLLTTLVGCIVGLKVTDTQK